MDPKPPLVALSDHPRAAASILQIKAWGGLLGFAVVAGFSYLGGMGVADALLRGVIAGVAGQMLAWIAAIVLWQHLLDGEAKSAVRQAKEKQRRALQRGSQAGTDA
jgi:uncharacterized membrane protein YccC